MEIATFYKVLYGNRIGKRIVVCISWIMLLDTSETHTIL